MADMARAASKIKTLARVAGLIPLVGPSAGGMLHGLARVCEAAARFRAEDREALKLMDRVAEVTEYILASHDFLRPEDAGRARGQQQDVEEMLATAQRKFLEVYGKAALATAKRAYRAVFSGADDVTFDSLEEKLRVALVWFVGLVQTIQMERAATGNAATMTSLAPSCASTS